MRTDDLQIYPRFEVREGRPGTGLGLFAKIPFQKGDFLLEYTGKKIPTVVADESDSEYLFEINADWTIDGPPEINLAGYINHDCHPNTESDIVDGRIIIEAIRDIAAGEELTIDYGNEYFDEFIRPKGCKCASCERGLPSPHYANRAQAD
ncbi:MAG TPA: SET domain-containing protein [Candidatus Paceibacterota bacterium]|nr:SET domain-containing protein [Candidatus Paceibacterota bacterium]